MKTKIILIVTLIVGIAWSGCKKITNCDDTDGALTSDEMSYFLTPNQKTTYKLIDSTSIYDTLYNVQSVSILNYGSPISSVGGCSHAEKTGIQQGFFRTSGSIFIQIVHIDKWQTKTSSNHITVDNDDFVFSNATTQNGVIVNGITYNNVLVINSSGSFVSTIYFVKGTGIIKFLVPWLGTYEKR